jgi:hypothetical protein
MFSAEILSPLRTFFIFSSVFTPFLCVTSVRCQRLYYTVSNGWVIDELETMWKEAAVVLLRCYPSVFLEELRKTMHNLSWDGRCPAEIRTQNLPNTNLERSICGSTAFVDLGRFFSFLITYIIGRTPWTGDQPVARPLPTHRINVHRHPCLEWDSNPRFQCSRGRRWFMT